MSKKISLAIALVGLCALSLLLLSCGSSSSRPSGVLYVLTQGGNGVGNNVTSFAIDLNSGNLSLVNSNASTCPTAATPTNTEPCGLPLDLLLDPTGATAFILNQGTPCVPQGNQCVGAGNILPSIYPYTVNSDGSLSAPGTVVNWTTSADTAVAMARDAAGQFLFVIDQGVYPPPTTCPAIGTATQSFPGCPSITVFAMKPGSTTLTVASQFFLSKTPSALSPITFTPSGSTTAQELLFVTNNYDLCTVGCVPASPPSVSTVSVYAVSSTGVLSEQPNSPYAISASDPVSVQAVNTNPAGKNTGGLFVYVGQGGSVGAVYPFEVCTVVGNAVCSQQQVTENLLFPLSTCPLLSCMVPPSSVGADPVAMLVDPTNNFLYVMSKGQSQVSAFQINTTAGKLTALSPPNLPTGSQPVAMAMHASVNAVGQALYSSSGQFLYTSNSGSSNITGFSLSTTTGTMSPPFTVSSPAEPSGIAVH
jgi:hypothetical protein